MKEPQTFSWIPSPNVWKQRVSLGTESSETSDSAESQASSEPAEDINRLVQNKQITRHSHCQVASDQEILIGYYMINIGHIEVFLFNFAINLLLYHCKFLTKWYQWILICLLYLKKSLCTYRVTQLKYICERKNIFVTCCVGSL